MNTKCLTNDFTKFENRHSDESVQLFIGSIINLISKQ